MTPADRPDERGQRVSDAVVESICKDANQHLALDLRDARATIADLRAENERLRAENATAKETWWLGCRETCTQVAASMLPTGIHHAVPKALRALTPPEPSP